EDWIESDGHTRKQGKIMSDPINPSKGRLIGALTAKLNLRAVQQITRRFAAGGLVGMIVVTADVTLRAGSGSGGAAPMAARLPPESVRALFYHACGAVRPRGFEGE